MIITITSVFDAWLCGHATFCFGNGVKRSSRPKSKQARLFTSFFHRLDTFFVFRRLQLLRTPKTRRPDFGGQWERVLTKHLHQALIYSTARPQGSLTFARYLFISDLISPFLHDLIKPRCSLAKVEVIVNGYDISYNSCLS